MSRDHAGMSLRELFRQETDAQAQVLIAGLLTLERDPVHAETLEACMRAAHSLKGAARIVNLDAAVRIAHVMEECLVAAQHHRLRLEQNDIDLLLTGVDLLSQLAAAPAHTEAAGPTPAVAGWLAEAAEVLRDRGVAPAGEPAAEPAAASPALGPREPSDRVLRVTAENLNRLLGLASESLVESRWITPFAQSLLRVKRMQQDVGAALDRLRDTLAGGGGGEDAQLQLASAQRRLLEGSQFLTERLAELDVFDQRSLNLSDRLYEEALALRMRPFSDGVEAFPRLVRDVARSLGKEVRLEITGESTQIDRDIIAMLDAPLGHLLRNAVDHGLETPEERRAAGKPPEGVIRLDARHDAGALLVTVSDDGRGVDVERVRAAVVERRLTTAAAAAALTDAELFEFLFLPGFTMKAGVTEVSGRGVGLDVVRDIVKRVRGTVQVTSQAGAGTTFRLHLPVTLSVLRTLLVDVGGEPYAFPLTSIVRTLRCAAADVQSIEQRQHIAVDGRRVGLVPARQVLGVAEVQAGSEELAVVIIGNGVHQYGLAVDRLLGERELVVQPLDSHFGKVQGIAAGALMEDGSPVLIVDTDDLIQAVDKLVAGAGLNRLHPSTAANTAVGQRKRVLVVDDSLTVRELERKLLANRGYDVEVAVDGMDGWNAVRTGHFNLVVTDIDMPRMDGIELVTLINRDPNLRSVPVMVVSYKDRDEDRRRGLDAGAAYYLTKSSFHDETLVQAVIDLIGGPDA